MRKINLDQSDQLDFSTIRDSAVKLEKQQPIIKCDHHLMTNSLRLAVHRHQSSGESYVCMKKKTVRKG